MFNSLSQIGLMTPRLMTGLLLYGKKKKISMPGPSLGDGTTEHAGCVGAASTGMCTLHIARVQTI